MITFHSPESPTYQQYRYSLISKTESVEPTAYLDSKGIPTIGIGFNLQDGDILVLVLKAFDLNAPKDSELFTTFDRIVEAPYANKADLQTALNAEMERQHAANPAIRSTFAFATDDAGIAEMRAVFDEAVLIYDNSDTDIGPLGRVDKWLAGIPDSRERAVLVSMSYNGLINTGASPSLRAAVLSGDRAEAWYQIRYQSNGGASASDGIAKRRYYESEVFSLTDTPGSVRDADEAKQMYRMFQLHRADILEYENMYSAQIDKANRDYGLSGIDEVDTLIESFDPAKAALFADLGLASLGLDANNYLSTDIQLDPGRDNAKLAIDPEHGAVLTGSARNDILIGEGGADTLKGLAGDDVLIGGIGTDFLNGGAGNDTYVYKAGDGFDIITDTDGGKIFVDGAQLTGGGAQYGENRVHRDANGRLYVDVGVGLMVDNKILIKDYQPNTFGVALTDPVPEPFFDPVTTNPIQNDESSIVDTAANDHIQTGNSGVRVTKNNSGDDRIDFGNGDDELWNTESASGRVVASGGAGRDYLGGGNQKDLVEGGAGADALGGGDEDDRLYGDAKGDTQAFITAGATQAGNGQQGEWFDGAGGDDQMFGGAGNDLVTAGAGDDLIVAGGGNDYIWGDLDTFAPLNDSAWKGWTVTPRVEPGPQGNTIYYDISGVVIENIDGTGNDVVYAGAGDDVVKGESGNDVLFGEGGEDTIWGGSGDDVLMGGDEGDRLIGENDNDTLFGGGGPDHLQGDDGADVLFGGDGIDMLLGGDGADTLEGGAEVDNINGGAGDDTYIVNKGDGEDHIFDTDENGVLIGDKTGKIIFGPGIDPQTVILRTGSLMLDLGNGDEVAYLQLQPERCFRRFRGQHLCL